MSILDNIVLTAGDMLILFDRLSPEDKEVVLEKLLPKEDGQNDTPKKEISLSEICGGWADDERTTEEIIKEIYESRTFGRERPPLL